MKIFIYDDLMRGTQIKRKILEILKNDGSLMPLEITGFHCARDNNSLDRPMIVFLISQGEDSLFDFRFLLDTLESQIIKALNMDLNFEIASNRIIEAYELI